MELSGAFVGVWGALQFLQVGWIVFLTVRAFRQGSPEQLQSAVRQLAIDVEELYGAVEKWTKRRYASEARERIGKTGPVNAVPTRGTPEYKNWLRRRAHRAGATGEPA